MIYETLNKYHELAKNDNNHRFKSWEHCYGFFSQNYHNLEDEKVIDHVNLHLAFYLASWGMLRGSSFLLQKDYRVHIHFLKNVVLNPDYFTFYNINNHELLDSNFDNIENLIRDTRKAYQDNINEINGKQTIINVTDTLASKILLGVFGNVPAYDRYFKVGLTLFGLRLQFDQLGLRDLVNFYHKNFDEFEYSKNLFSYDGVNYTPMKLLDMFFWKVGFMIDNFEVNFEELKKISDFAEQYKINEKDLNTVINTYLPITKKQSVINKGLTDEIRKYITSKLNHARKTGEDYLDLRSGDIHKEMGLKDRLPSVCQAMESLGVYKYTIIKDTPSGKSSTKVIRYFFSN